MIRRLAACAALAATLGPFGPAAADDDLEITFNDHCRECHFFVKDDNRLGPSLYGVVGRKAGALPGFGYSESLKDSGVT
jgi:cytochrome c